MMPQRQWRRSRGGIAVPSGITGGTLGSAGTGITLTDGNKTATKSSGAGWASTRSNVGISSGKHYCEFLINHRGATASTVEIGVGIIDGDNALTNFMWAANYGYAYGAEQGRILTTAPAAAFGATYTAGDVIGMAIDADAGKIWFSKNDVWQGGGDPESGINPAATIAAGTYYPAVSLYESAGSSATSKFDTVEISGTVPSGYAAGVGV